MKHSLENFSTEFVRGRRKQSLTGIIDDCVYSALLQLPGSQRTRYPDTCQAYLGDSIVVEERPRLEYFQSGRNFVFSTAESFERRGAARRTNQQPTTFQPSIERLITVQQSSNH
jgi:hypothetical protein